MSHLSGFRLNFIVYILALGIILGSGYTMYKHFDFSHSVDTKSYLKMARGDFEVKVTHRYRVIVPFLAAAVAWPIETVYAKLWPNMPGTDGPLRLGFYVINSLLVALAGLYLFKTCLAYGASFWASAVAMAAVLSARWVVYFVGLPMIDSLYLLVFALTIYGIKTRNPWIIILCIFLGPHSKESFIFLAPLTFFYGHHAVSRVKQIGLYLVSGGLVFGLRYFIDASIDVPQTESVDNMVDHFDNIIVSLQRIFSPKGFGELFSIFSVFNLVILAGLLGGKEARKAWLSGIDAPLWWLVPIVIVHALLSTEVSRMLFLAAPLFAVAVALILDKHPLFAVVRERLWLK